MQRHRISLALMAAGLLIFGMTLCAAPVPQEDIIAGTVIRVGEAKLTLVASDSYMIHRFKVATDAIISRDGRTVKLEEIAFGDSAFVSSQDNDDIRIATVIAAISPSKQQREQR